MKNKYTILIVTALVVTSIAMSPLTGFAKEKEDRGNGRDDNSRNNTPKALGIGNGGQNDLPPGIEKKLDELEKEMKKESRNGGDERKDNSRNDSSNIFRQFRAWFNNRFNNGSGDNRPNNSATSTLPTINNFKATSTRQRSATVSWMTNEKATSLIWYATTSPVNTLAGPNISRSGLIEKHRFNIDRLLPGTKYFVVVGSRDRDGNLVVSNETSFTTKNPPVPTNKAPVITGIAGTTTVAVNATSTWTVQAYDPENGTLNYSVDWGDVSAAAKAALTATDIPVVQTSTFTHIYSAAGTYTATFTVEDDSGHVVTASRNIVVNALP